MNSEHFLCEFAGKCSEQVSEVPIGVNGREEEDEEPLPPAESRRILKITVLDEGRRRVCIFS